jgi:hypothetical protein
MRNYIEATIAIGIMLLAIVVYNKKTTVHVEKSVIPPASNTVKVDGKVVTDAYTGTQEKFAKIREAMVGVESAKVKLEAAKMELEKIRSDADYNKFILSRYQETEAAGVTSARTVSDMEQQTKRDVISIRQAENKIKDSQTDIRLAEAKVATEMSKLDEEELKQWNEERKPSP